MKLGSLFDGSGTAPLAASMCGIEPVWASEIEPYPITVTKARFPNMLHLGDITKINGAEVEPVDIICGGSPCQDLSVAGKQAGLHDGERSHLFFEMTRIIKEMREATNGKYPRYIIWENVPGAFSSNKGRDFLAVLQAFAEIADPNIHVPEPKQKASGAGLAWKYAGYVAGDGWSIAWRTVDAQYWGVPQRRRRIYLVTDLGGECADEILFERKGVSGNPAQGRTPWQGLAADAQNCAGAADREVEGFDGYNGDLAGGVSATLGVNCGMSTGRNGVIERRLDAVVYAIDQQGGKGWRENECYTLNTIDRPGVVFTADCRNGAMNEELSGTLQAKPNGGYSLNYQNPVMYEAHGFGKYRNGCGNLRASGGDCGPGSEMLCVEESKVQTSGFVDDEVFPDVTGALCANSHPGSYTGQDAFNNMLPVVPSDKPPRKYIVRRLTPLECCRLQGFPDWWEDGVEGSDSARYKMWGNGMALPNMLHVMKGIARVEQEGKR